MLRSKLWFKVPVGSQHLGGCHPTPDPQYWKNVVKPTINSPFWNSLHHRFLVKLWMVYDWGYHMKENIDHNLLITNERGKQKFNPCNMKREKKIN
jgi:hypothetical protein